MRDVSLLESAVLGALLLNPSRMDETGAMLTPDAFADGFCRAAFAAMLEAHASGQRPTIETLALRLGRSDARPLADPVLAVQERLHAILARVATDADLTGHARAVRDYASLRALSHTASLIVERASAADASELPRLLGDAQAELAGLAERGREGGAAPLSDMLAEAFRASEAAAKRGGMAGASTGFARIDENTGGLLENALWVIGGPTGGGKSALAQRIAANVAQSGQHVAFFSLEMSPLELTHRLIAMHSGLNLLGISCGRLDNNDWRLYAEALNAEHATAARFHVDARARLTLADVRAELRRLAERGVRVGLCVVDYLQLMTATGHADTREQQVAQVVRGLKQIAVEFACPVVACSQLSRAVGNGEDPELSHLRESGEVEHAAHVVLLLARAAPDARVISVKIAKGRLGRRVLLRLAWTPECVRFTDLLPGSPN